MACVVLSVILLFTGWSQESLSSNPAPEGPEIVSIRGWSATLEKSQATDHVRARPWLLRKKDKKITPSPRNLSAELRQKFT